MLVQICQNQGPKTYKSCSFLFKKKSVFRTNGDCNLVGRAVTVEEKVATARLDYSPCLLSSCLAETLTVISREVISGVGLTHFFTDAAPTTTGYGHFYPHTPFTTNVCHKTLSHCWRVPTDRRWSVSDQCRMSVIWLQLTSSCLHVFA